MLEIRELMEIIRKKIENEEITSQEQALLNNISTKYIKEFMPRNENGRIKTQEDLSFLEIFEYATKDITRTKYLEEINIFKTLLKYRGSSVKLSELYKEIYKGIYSNSEIEEHINNPEILKAFFEKLNGAVIEESVFGVDMSEFNPKDLSSIKTKTSTDIDPVLFVKSTKSVPMYDVDMSVSDDITILTFPDLHIDKGCYTSDKNGNLVIDQEKLNERLLSFIMFRDSLILKLRTEGIHVAGVVYTGDVLETFTSSSSKGIVTRKSIDSLIRGFETFNRRAQRGEIIKNESISLSSDDSYFVAYLAGNHDIRIGREAFDRIMTLFRNSAGKNVVELGNGSARIKVCDEFISFMHHNSLDWGMNGKEGMVLRKAKNKETYHFEEYFSICEAIFKTDEFQQLMNDNKNVDPVMLLMKTVNEKMKKENPRLYHSYLPYIITNADTLGTYQRVEEVSENGKFTHVKVQKDIPFFRNFIELENDNGALKLVIRKKTTDGIEVPVLPVTEHFKTFVDDENGELSYTERLNKASREYIDYLKANGKEEIASELLKIVYKVIPQFGRTDKYTPVLYSLSHFHDKPYFVGEVGEQPNTYTLSEGPLVYTEGTTKVSDNPEFNFDIYESLEGKNNIFDKYVSRCKEMFYDSNFKYELKKAKGKNPKLDVLEFLMTKVNISIIEEAKEKIEKYRLSGAEFQDVNEENRFLDIIKLYSAVETFADPCFNEEEYLKKHSKQLIELGMSPESSEHKKEMAIYKKTLDNVPYFKKHISIRKNERGQESIETTNPNSKPVIRSPLTGLTPKETKFTAGIISIDTSAGKISKISIKSLLSKVSLIRNRKYYFVNSEMVEGTDYSKPAK